MVHRAQITVSWAGVEGAEPVEFAYLEDGPDEGPPALCLHGFPDHAPTWADLLGGLAAAGFHAVAPWMRGYAASSWVPVPTFYLHGADDGCIGAELVAPDEMKPLFAGGLDAEILPGVGHFLHLEDPAGVNRRIVEFLTDDR